MIDSEISEEFRQASPVRYKVIGIGAGTTDVIEKVKSFGYDCVGCILAETPGDCIPMDDDIMVIIVARDNEEVANAIAKAYHDAKVLTLGMVNNADIVCYDSVAKDSRYEDFPEIIRTLLQPLVTYGYICYDYCDLCTTLHGSLFFKTIVSDGKSIEETVYNMKKELENVAVERINRTSALLYFNRERQPNITMEDMAPFVTMTSSLQESIDVIFGINIDNTLPDDLIRITTILSGKEL